jgi:hypothetical protein
VIGLVIREATVQGKTQVNVALEATTAAPVGAFTAAIVYDPKTLRFASADAIGDGAIRALNPSPGLIVFAGANVNGFGRTLAGFVFTSDQDNVAPTVHLDVREIHLLSGRNIIREIVVAPTLTATGR